MILTEHLQCGVCGELKPNPQEAQCCHKLFCLDCIESCNDADHCPACRAITSFGANIFASRIINIEIGKNPPCQSFANTSDDTDTPGAFPINILTMTGKKINVVVEKSDTIHILKLKIELKDGMARVVEEDGTKYLVNTKTDYFL